MSGHSKWSTIKHKKGKEDARRGKVFTKIIKEMTVAARTGGGDADANPRLRAAVTAAKAANMPAENITRAIQRGTGELPGVIYEEVNYEAYGPGGVALLIETMTDNRNRTTPEIRHMLSKYGGNLGETGSVGWIFERKGQILVDKNTVEEEKLIELALEAGAEDMTAEDEFFVIVTSQEAFNAVKEKVEGAKVSLVSSEIAMVPQNYVPLESKKADQMIRLMDALEEHDDVQKVWANFDISEGAAASGRV